MIIWMVKINVNHGLQPEIPADTPLSSAELAVLDEALPLHLRKASRVRALVALDPRDTAIWLRADFSRDEVARLEAAVQEAFKPIDEDISWRLMLPGGMSFAWWTPQSVKGRDQAWISKDGEGQLGAQSILYICKVDSACIIYLLAETSRNKLTSDLFSIIQRHPLRRSEVFPSNTSHYYLSWP